ncbi:alpha/beta hydrolase [Alcaligenaceae bacterium]|nr:alpha/beta hydrolase [Alcaligenaceae bacterium]
MRAAYADIGGIRTRYLYAGAGPAVFLLHGIGFSADCFIHNIDVLAKSFSVYAVDLLGHGFTDAPDYEGVVPQIAMARHIAALADQLGLASYSIVGSSFGAHVAAHVYLENVSCVDKLVLVGSGSVFHSGEEQRKTLIGSLANGKKAMIEASIDSCRKRLENIVFSPSCVPSELLWIQVTIYAEQDRVSTYEAAIKGSVQAMDAPGARVLGQLETIKCPSLVIVGRNDIRADWTSHVDGAARMPAAEVSIYESCGHFPFLEYPEIFNPQVARFLSESPVHFN